MSEAALAKRVVDWLVSQHYDVFQEVQVVTYGAVADIVVDVNGRGWVIECKKSFGLAVIGQAREWQRYSATRVSVAIPKTKRNTAAHRVGDEICQLWGIGTIELGKHGVRETREPRFWRLKRGWGEDILNACGPKHKTGAKAGSADGGHWTPYSTTMDGVKEFLIGKGWMPLKAIVDGVEHHYSSTSCARSSLAQRLRTIEGEKGWIEWRTEGRRLEFRLRQVVEEK